MRDDSDDREWKFNTFQNEPLQPTAYVDLKKYNQTVFIKMRVI